MKEAGPRILKALTAIASHTIVAAAIILSAFAIHSLIEVLMPGSTLIKHLFTGADVAVIIAFIVSSAVEYWKAMGE